MRLPHWLLKLGFHLLYYQFAWSYELVAWLVSFGQWSTWRRLALKFMQPGPVLELAHGSGVFFTDMIEAGYQPVGIDLSPYMARLAGKRLKQRNCIAPLSRARAQALPFPSGYFANVVATFPTDYMLADETMSEIYRILQDSASIENGAPGRLIIVAEGQLRGPWPFCSLIDWLYKITGQRNIPPPQPITLLTTHNFEARWEIAGQQNASARLIIADKKSLRSSSTFSLKPTPWYNSSLGD